MNVRLDPSGPLKGTIVPPADKSISHRVAMLGAMADIPVRIHNYLDAADTNSTLAAVEALGALVERRADEIVIRGAGLRAARAPDGVIDVGNAGTLMRLLPGWLAAQEGHVFTLDGDASIRGRPVDRIAAPLREMGADIRATGDRFPPFTVTGTRLHGIDYVLPVASAQVKSCVLFAGMLADGETTIREPQPSRDHTERLLAGAGVPLTPRGWRAAADERRRARAARDPRGPGRPVVGGVRDRGGRCSSAARGSSCRTAASTGRGPGSSGSPSAWARSCSAISRSRPATTSRPPSR